MKFKNKFFILSLVILVLVVAVGMYLNSENSSITFGGGEFGGAGAGGSW